MVHITLFPVLNPLYFHISTSRSICTVPNMAVFCSSLTSCCLRILLFLFYPVCRRQTMLPSFYVSHTVHYTTINCRKSNQQCTGIVYLFLKIIYWFIAPKHGGATNRKINYKKRYAIPVRLLITFSPVNAVQVGTPVRIGGCRVQLPASILGYMVSCFSWFAQVRPC